VYIGNALDSLAKCESRSDIAYIDGSLIDLWIEEADWIVYSVP